VTFRFPVTERGLLGAVSVIGVLVIWEVALRTGLLETRFLVPPSEVVAAGALEVQNPRFWRDLQVSFFEFIVGYLAAVVLGVGLGVILGWYRRLGYLFEPLMNFIYAVPRIALLPLIVLWLGLTVWSKVAVVFLGAWITIMLNTFYGVRTVDPRLLSVARTFGASPRKLFISVVLPGSVPFILAGLRLGVGRALIGVVVGELYAASAGLGFMITVASNNLQVGRVLFGTFLFILLGVVSVEAVRRVERRYSIWRQDLSTSP
jgi:ABC-type nitrate/sulfonate/bicarbonate transport system permease component